MNTPKLFNEGLKTFNELYSGKGVSLVAITSNDGRDCQEDFVELLRESVAIPPERLFKYTPPASVGYVNCRIEKIPHLTHPADAHIILDDVIETGKTLNACVTRLSEQGVSMEQIWFNVLIIRGFRPYGSGPFLDRATAFYDYLQSVGK